MNKEEELLSKRIQELAQNDRNFFRGMPRHHIGVNRRRGGSQPQINSAHAVLEFISGAVLRPENIAVLPDGRSAVKLPELDQHVRSKLAQCRMNVVKQPVECRFQRTEIPPGGIFFPHRILPAQQEINRTTDSFKAA